jgi:hypothetical protein
MRTDAELAAGFLTSWTNLATNGTQRGLESCACNEAHPLGGKAQTAIKATTISLWVLIQALLKPDPSPLAPGAL